ncbi:hypothetical protein D3C73_1070070 [compost metagenome]
MRLEQNGIQIDRTELNVHQVLIEMQTILFLQTFQNDLIGRVRAVDHERHTDEVILDDQAAVGELLLFAPARLRGRFDDDAGQGVVVRARIVVRVDVRDLDLRFHLLHDERHTERDLPRFHGSLVGVVENVQQHFIRGLVVPQWADVRTHINLLGFLNGHLSVPAQGVDSCLEGKGRLIKDHGIEIAFVKHDARALTDHVGHVVAEDVPVERHWERGGEQRPQIQACNGDITLALEAVLVRVREGTTGLDAGCQVGPGSARGRDQFHEAWVELGAVGFIEGNQQGLKGTVLEQLFQGEVGHGQFAL